MTHISLEPCPACGGEIVLYSTTRMGINYNCYAKCKACGTEYPMPEARLAANGARIYPSSIRKAERCWNRLATAHRVGKDVEQDGQP